MKKQTIPLGRIMNIPIGLDFSWFLIFILISWSLSTQYFPAEFTALGVGVYWGMGVISALLLFASVLLHELGHSAVALKYKIPVQRITLFIFGGVAQIGAEPPSPWAEFWIAIAGPLVSFALAGVFSLLAPLSQAFTPVFGVAKYLAFLNGSLGLFNLIPGFPLDGGRVFRAILWGFSKNLRRATIVAANVGRIIAFLFILFGVWQVLGGNLGGLWIVLIGWFLESAANAQVHQQILHEQLAEFHASQVMKTEFAYLAGDQTLRQAIDHFSGSYEQRYFLIQGDRGDPVGYLSWSDILAVPSQEWPYVHISQVMKPIDKLHSLTPQIDLWKALEAMDEDGVNQIPVVENDHMVGMLSREGVFRFLEAMRKSGAAAG